MYSGGFQRISNFKNQFKYNGKEEITDLGLDWYDYGARMFMPDIGRFGGLDVKADIYRSYTPYAYSLNNPILFVDKNGEGPKPKNKGKQINVNSIDNTKRIQKHLHKGTAAGRKKALEIALFSVGKSYDNDWHETAYEDAEFTETGKAATQIDSKYDGIEVFGQTENGDEVFLFRVENTGKGFVESLRDFVGTDNSTKTIDATEFQKFHLDNIDQDELAKLADAFGDDTADPTNQDQVRGGRAADGSSSSGSGLRRRGNGKPKEFYIDPALNDTVRDTDGTIKWINRYNGNSGRRVDMHKPPINNDVENKRKE